MDDHAAPERPDYAAQLMREEMLVRAAEASLDRGEFVTLKALEAWADSLDPKNELPPPLTESALKTPHS